MNWNIAPCVQYIREKWQRVLIYKIEFVWYNVDTERICVNFLFHVRWGAQNYGTMLTQKNDIKLSVKSLRRYVDNNYSQCFWKSIQDCMEAKDILRL